MLRRGLAAILFAAVLVPGTQSALSAPAAAEITELYLSAAPGDPAQTVFPPNAQSVWVTFGYSELSNTTVEISLAAPNGLRVFARDAELSGAGQETWQITGEVVAQSLVEGLTESAEAAGTNARLAAEQTRGINEYLAAVTYAVGRMHAAVTLLSRVDLGSDANAQLVFIVGDTNELVRLVAAVNALSPDDLERRQALAADMVTPASSARRDSQALEGLIRDATGLPLPATRSAHDENDAYTVTARMNGSPARSTSVWFQDVRIYLPWSSAPEEGR